jgi:formate--tetrahydrofolate ligase
MGGLEPAAAVIVATVRALKMHGGVAKGDLGREDVRALKAGLPNLRRHIENMLKFGVPVVVAINHFTGDTAAEMDVIEAECRALGVNVHICRHWADGGIGAIALAEDVAAMPLADKIRVIAGEIYRARDVAFSDKALAGLAAFESAGFGAAPVCMAKTQYSFSADPALLGAPTDFVLPVRDVRLSAGAGFVVALCGDVMTMPGLPRHPAAERIHLDDRGEISGLT